MTYNKIATSVECITTRSILMKIMLDICRMREWLTITLKVPFEMVTFRAPAKKRLRDCRSSTKAKNKRCKQLTEGFCSDSGAACVMGAGEEGDNILKLAGTADIC